MKKLLNSILWYVNSRKEQYKIEAAISQLLPLVEKLQANKLDFKAKDVAHDVENIANALIGVYGIQDIKEEFDVIEGKRDAEKVKENVKDKTAEKKVEEIEEQEIVDEKTEEAKIEVETEKYNEDVEEKKQESEPQGGNDADQDEDSEEFDDFAMI